MGSLFPFRDINVHASISHYAFTSPSSPSAQTLVVERPSGDLRMSDGALLGAKRVSSIAGILGIIRLGLGIVLLAQCGILFNFDQTSISSPSPKLNRWVV